MIGDLNNFLCFFSNKNDANAKNETGINETWFLHSKIWIRTKQLQNSFEYQGVKIWNLGTENLQKFSFDWFKIKYKRYLLSHLLFDPVLSSLMEFAGFWMVIVFTMAYKSQAEKPSTYA